MSDKKGKSKCEKTSKNVSQQRKGSLREVPPTKVCERGEHSTRLVTTAPRERGKIILVEVAPPQFS